MEANANIHSDFSELLKKEHPLFEWHLEQAYKGLKLCIQYIFDTSIYHISLSPIKVCSFPRLNSVYIALPFLQSVSLYL